ncbi:hypothetical protein HGM15179_021732, partial [Zosterops borbonicus]
MSGPVQSLYNAGNPPVRIVHVHLLKANEIAKLLSSDDINVPDEEAIFQALMMWVRHDLQNRQRDLGMLLSYIRLPLLPPQ